MKFPRRRSIAIVADGPSASPLRHFDIPQEIYVIAVNFASIWLPRVNAYFTAIPDHRQRFAMNHQRQGVRYFAAVSELYGANSPLAHPHERAPRERNVTFMRQIYFDEQETPGMAEPPGISVGWRHGAINSVFGALNLALHMKADRIALIGLDLNEKPRVSGGRPTGLSGVGRLFDHYNGDAVVVNGTPHSPVVAFPTTTPIEAIQWLL